MKLAGLNSQRQILERNGVYLLPVIIGHHSHVPQGIEKIDDSLIFYSLGNFLFNLDYHNAYSWTAKSFVPKITFHGNEIAAVELNPLVIDLDPYQVRAATPIEADPILTHLGEISALAADDKLLVQQLDQFYTKTLLPELFNFIKRYDSERDSEFAALIENYKHCAPIHNLFAGFVELYVPDNGAI